jgi:O-antigen ligase
MQTHALNPSAPGLACRDGTLAQRIQWARQADPFGHRVHVCLATVALFMLPWSTWFATAALITVAAWALCRFWVLGPVWALALRHPVVLLLLGFLAWSALSLTWTLDLDEGSETLGAQRFLLLIPALVPLGSALRWPLLALVGGVAVQAVAQVLLYVGAIEEAQRWPWRLNGGMSSHPGPTGAWSLTAMGIALSPAAGATIWPRGIMLVFAFCSLLLSGSRSAVVAMVLFVVTVLASIRGGMARPIASTSCGLVIAFALIIAFSSLDSARYVRKAITQIPAVLTGDTVFTSVGVRLALWEAGIDAGLESPWRGTGLGGRVPVIQSHAAVLRLEAHSKGKWQYNEGDLHSGWVGSFTELGAPGLVLFGLPAILSVWYAMRAARGAASGWGPALLAATTTWFASGVFHVVFASGQLMAQGMLAVTLVVLASRGGLVLASTNLDGAVKP